MIQIVYLIFGIVVIIIGFRMYAYFNKNLESIDNEPGNLYGAAVLVIIIGGILSVLSILNLIRNFT